MAFRLLLVALAMAVLPLASIITSLVVTNWNKHQVLVQQVSVLLNICQNSEEKLQNQVNIKNHTFNTAANNTEELLKLMPKVA